MGKEVLLIIDVSQSADEVKEFRLEVHDERWALLK